MRQVLRIAMDLVLEALRRRWFLALFGGIALVLLVLGLTLELDVVDGALAGSRLFGAMLSDDVMTASRVLAGVFQGAAYVSFYGGGFFLAVACSDFAPELLSPGRIEHLLSLPVARWQLLLGTWLGVLVVTSSAVLFGAAGLTVMLGVKTGVWSGALLVGSLLGLSGFCAMYAAMLCSTFFVRSAALSGAVGILTLVLGVVASFRESLAALMDPGPGRLVFQWAMVPIPRLGTLATVSARLAAELPVDSVLLWRMLGGCALFSLAALAIAAWRFERMDF